MATSFKFTLYPFEELRFEIRSKLVYEQFFKNFRGWDTQRAQEHYLRKKGFEDISLHTTKHAVLFSGKILLDMVDDEKPENIYYQYDYKKTYAVVDTRTWDGTTDIHVRINAPNFCSKNVEQYLYGRREKHQEIVHRFVWKCIEEMRQLSCLTFEYAYKVLANEKDVLYYADGRKCSSIRHLTKIDEENTENQNS